MKTTELFYISDSDGLPVSGVINEWPGTDEFEVVIRVGSETMRFVSRRVAVPADLSELIEALESAKTRFTAVLDRS